MIAGKTESTALLHTAGERILTKYAKRKLLYRAHLDLTYLCELDCVHCYLDDRTKPGPSTETWFDVIDQLYEMGTFAVLLSGGEIFLRDDIWEILARLKKYRFNVKVKTHGIRMTKAFVQKIKDAGVHAVDVSLYSNIPQVHDRITRRPGSQRRTAMAVKNLTEIGIPVHINNTVTNQNPGSDGGVAEFAASVGISSTSSSRIRASQTDGSTEVYSTGIALHQSMEVAARTRLGVIRKSAWHRGAQRPVGERPAPPPLKEQEMCGAGRHLLYIGPDGEITPCNTVLERLGNVQTDRIRDVWENHQRIKEMQSRRANARKDCEGCAYMEGCQFCPGMAQMETGFDLGPAVTTCRESQAKYLAKKQLTFGGLERKVFFPIAKMMSNGERKDYLDAKIAGVEPAEKESAA